MTPFLGGLLLGFILGALTVLAVGAAADQDARRHTTPDEDRVPHAARLDELDRQHSPAFPQRAVFTAPLACALHANACPQCNPERWRR